MITVRVMTQKAPTTWLGPSSCGWGPGQRERFAVGPALPVEDGAFEHLAIGLDLPTVDEAAGGTLYQNG